MPATVVLVHGAWRGAWCWERAIVGVAARGVDAVAIDPGAAREIFYADCADADVDRAIARLGPQPSITFQQPVSAAAWREVPSTYAVCAEDRAIAVWIQHTFAERATNSVVWPTSHSPFLSEPDLVVDLLAALATA